MKIMTRPVLVLVALWCMAVFLVPYALAADQGSGTMQAPGGSGHGPGEQGSSNQMQAPPSGSQGNSGSTGGSGQQGGYGGQGSGSGGQMQEPPSGMTGNISSSRGHGGMQNDGNMTLREPPALDAANMTAFAGRGGWQGDGNMTLMGDGNRAPPDFGNETFRGMDSPGVNGNMTSHAFGNETSGNGTPSSDRPDNVPSGRGQQVQSGVQSSGLGQQQAQQQAREDVIADLISKLQALLSGKQ